jgi:hypothetical protein
LAVAISQPPTEHCADGPSSCSHEEVEPDRKADPEADDQRGSDALDDGRSGSQFP